MAGYNGYEETDNWKDYEVGKNYKTDIGLFPEVNKHIDFYEGRQWEGVVSNGLPTPVLNLIKRIVDHKINTVMGEDLKVNYSIDGIDDEDYNPDSAELREVARVLSSYSETLWEANQEDGKNEQVLLDGALTGDGLEYFRWDSTINAGNGIKGNVVSEIIDNVNYFPANPNSKDVQSQTSITIAFRQMISDLKKEATENGIPKDEYDKITCDNDTDYQSGKLSKIELTQSKKAIAILKMYKKDGKVYFNKSTRYARITKNDIDSGLTLYPIALFNWGLRKNCCHGLSEVKGLIPNQIAINKLVAMVIMSVMHTAFPKLVYDSSRIAQPSNLVGAAIGVSGDIDRAAKYLMPGQLSNDIYKTVDVLIQYTKEMAGATDAALGEVRPDNTSAIIVLQKAASIPLKSISGRFMRFNEDKARIYMDFFLNKYIIERKLTYKDNGITKTFNFDGSKYGDMVWRVKIDVGASTHWSEITALQTLDNLLLNNRVTFPQYLERVPSGIIPMKDRLLQDIQSQDLDKQLMVKIMADYVEGLPPEMQAQIQAMKPEEMESQVKQMILQEQGGTSNGQM